MTDVADLVVRIRADASELASAMKDAEGQVKDSAGNMEKAFDSVKESARELLPVLSAAAFVEFGKNAIEAATQLDNMGLRIGFAASSLSVLEPLLRATGTNITEFSFGVNLMNARIGLAVDGNKQAILSFDKLGLSVNALKALSPEQQFYAIAQALGQVKDQFTQTEEGRAIFGRGFANILPLIKEANGDLAEHVRQLKAQGEGMSDENIKRVHEFGTALEDAGIRARNAFLEALGALLRMNDEMLKETGSRFPGPFGGLSNMVSIIANDSQMQEMQKQQDWVQKSKKLGYVTEPTIHKSPQSANGSNADLLASLDKKTGNDDSLPDNQDESKLQQYIADLGSEADAIKLSTKALADQKAIIEATKKAKDDYDNGLRDSPLLYDNEVKSITQSTDALIDFKKQQEEATKLATKMKEQFASSLADIAINFKGMGSTVTQVIQNIAKEIIQAKITQPFSGAVVDALGGKGGSGGILSSIGSWLGGLFKFADGGDPPVGTPSIVGENGPELFVPRTAGTVIPNGGFGGTQISIVQQFNMSPGLQGTVEAEVRRAAPLIAAQTHAMVFDSIQRGGREAMLVGKR